MEQNTLRKEGDTARPGAKKERPRQDRDRALRPNQQLQVASLKKQLDQEVPRRQQARLSQAAWARK